MRSILIVMVMIVTVMFSSCSTNHVSKNPTTTLTGKGFLSVMYENDSMYLVKIEYGIHSRSLILLGTVSAGETILIPLTDNQQNILVDSQYWILQSTIDSYEDRYIKDSMIRIR